MMLPFALATVAHNDTLWPPPSLAGLDLVPWKVSVRGLTQTISLIWNSCCAAKFPTVSISRTDLGVIVVIRTVIQNGVSRVYERHDGTPLAALRRLCGTMYHR